MIKVSIIRNQNGVIRSFIMKGHAESGPYGQDLVCAGASAVSFGTINAIEELCQFTPDVETREDGGFLRMDLPDMACDEPFRKAQVLLEGMIVSLKTIERDYSQYIQVNEEKKRI
ncbi:ribosomal-processing cysteine protease Prp [Fictibacillus sp. Mic-4]|uniref:ribosomal-processing cysteine protease Prp n=1 Tax=Fictibacillus TaxID=1329200 RepID=UPI0003F72A8D|nr:ribosomal-processing cysteine protease Prp [Fictibacillus gelatini]